MHNHITKQQVLGFRQQVVRDLAWSLWGPALLIHSAPYNEKLKGEKLKNEELKGEVLNIKTNKLATTPYFPLDIVWLQQLDQQPQLLLAYLERKNTRLLGTYFEALWQFYFSHHSNFQYCLCNLQVNDSTRTVGEFDVLVSNKQAQNFHIELTCKFYLEWQDALQENLWIGPNCSDRLDIKYHKTHAHQLPLLNTELGQKACIEHTFNIDNVKQLAIWRGTSFDRSHWFRAREWESESTLKELKFDDQILWLIADKSLWLSPVTQERAVLKTYTQINQQISDHFQSTIIPKKHYTLMLIALAFNKSDRQWQQQQRFFITANNWPYGKWADSALTPLLPCKPPL
jgi:hypothetical protein